MPSRFDDDGFEVVSAPPQGIPLKLRIAGMIWIGFGGLLVFMHGLQLLIGMAQGAKGDGAKAIGGICPGLLWIGVGGVFVLVGIQSVLGKAAGTLGNGIGSIIFGLFPMGALPLAIKTGNILLLVIGVFSFVAGAGLIVAGILAILSREEYRLYRERIKVAGKRERGRRQV